MCTRLKSIGTNPDCGRAAAGPYESGCPRALQYKKFRAMGTRLVQSPQIDPRNARFPLEIRKLRIHRLGVYAAGRIPARRKVIEHTGERISRREATQLRSEYPCHNPLGSRVLLQQAGDRAGRGIDRGLLHFGPGAVAKVRLRSRGLPRAD